MRLINAERIAKRNIPSRLKGTLTVYESVDDIPNDSTHLIGHLKGLMYIDLLNILGEPTYSTPSLDDKVQKEWVVEFIPKEGTNKNKTLRFRIYDWKTGSEWHTVTYLEEWSIGGDTDSHADSSVPYPEDIDNFKELLFAMSGTEEKEISNPK